MRNVDSPKFAYTGDLDAPDADLSADDRGAHWLATIEESQKFALKKNDVDPVAGGETPVISTETPGAAGSQTESGGKSGKAGNIASCPVSTEYNTLIEKAYRNVFDPTALGDLASLKNKHNCEIKNPADAFRFVNQELDRVGDHYTKVLNPTQVKQLDGLMKGEGKGIGLEVTAVDPVLAKETGSLKVMEVFPGSSAAKMGVKRGDYISKVDGVDLTTKTPEQGYALLQSEKTHTVTVVRDGQPVDLTLRQTALDVPAVVDRMIPGTNIAYIRIRDFMKDEESYELQKAIKRYPYVDGFIFDVRGNLGGSVDQALQSASMIVGKGTLLTTKKRHEDDHAEGKPSYDIIDYTLTDYELVRRDVGPDGKVNEKRDLRLADLVDKPTVVLVNGDTASAAEIFAGALQQNGEADLVGTQTFGKGIGQTVFFNQPAGSRLQVTNFRFFTPNGEWIGDAAGNRIGIKPNQVVENGKYFDPESDSDNQFQAAIADINEKLGRASQNKKAVDKT